MTQRDIPGPRFAKLMETYGVKPAELGITSRYKHMLECGDRHPSRDLVVRLCALIYGKHGVVPPECQPYMPKAGVAGPPHEPPTAGSSILQFHEAEVGTRAVHSRRSYEARIGTGMQPSARATAPTRRVETSTPRVEELADVAERGDVVEYVKRIVSSAMFMKWVRQNYSRGQYYHVKAKAPVLVKALKQPGILSQFSRRYAEQVVGVAYIVKRFCEAYNLPVPDIDTKKLRKFLPRKTTASALAAKWLNRLREDVLQQYIDLAVRMIEEIKRYGLAARKLLIVTAFFTGLRGTEIVYMVNNWRKLPKEHVDGLVVVELAYDRGPKKAYITLMPAKLAEYIDRFVESGGKMGAWIVSNTNHYYRVQVKMYRKVWIALTMRAGMDESWRDALQGRIPSIQVRHYVENIQDAVEYYKRAFEEYMKLL
jgi:hypothetical protein